MPAPKVFGSSIFLLPKSEKYREIDRICQRLTLLAFEKGFLVRGVEFHFRYYHGYSYCQIERMVAEDFSIEFSRIQEKDLPGGGYNYGAVSEIVIPRKRIGFCYDGSGLFLWIYSDEDWEAHREIFAEKFPREPFPFKVLCYEGKSSEHEEGEMCTLPEQLVFNPEKCGYCLDFGNSLRLPTREVLGEFMRYLEYILHRFQQSH